MHWKVIANERLLNKKQTEIQVHILKKIPRSLSNVSFISTYMPKPYTVVDHAIIFVDIDKNIKTLLL